MKISILILTHNRPELFKRCLNSVLYNKPDWAEIVVNNDSNDIEEIGGVTYFYKQDHNLSNIYNFLIEQAVGEYLYFLEDDDYVSQYFWDMIENGVKSNNTLFFNYIPFCGIREYFDRFHNTITAGEYKKDDFLEVVSEEHFQLSQFVFRKCDITTYMKNNILNNDWMLFLGIENDILYDQRPLFVQTVDGLDNISFKKYCNDERFKDDNGLR